MYFLTEINHDGTHRIVANCCNAQHKPVITANYCRTNNITMFNNREHINMTLRDKAICTYPLSPNRSVVLECVYKPETYIFNGYVAKRDIGYIEWSFYNPIDLPLSELEF